MLLSVLILLFVAAAMWRGWLRGIFVETFDLVGLALAALCAAWTWGVAGPGGALVVLVGGAVGVLVASRPVARAGAEVPLGVLRASRVAGSTFAGTWAVILATSILLLGTTFPTTRLQVAGPVCGAPVARYLALDDHPLLPAGERLARWTQPLVVWASQHLRATFTLAGAPPAALAPPPPLDLCEELARHRETVAAAADMDAGGFRFPPAAPGDLTAAVEAEAEVLAFLNGARAAAGLPALAADDELAAVGRAHATDMYLRGYFAHETPECADGVVPGCRDPFNRIRAAGITYATAGENLALAPTAAAAHEGLMDSPGHRANILDPRYRRVGIGIVRGPVGLMVTQEFAG